MKVGFIGLGTMGSGMAMNVLKGGHELVVHDINREAVGLHLEAGAAWADTPQQVMELSEVVFTSLPGPPEVQAVALGANGLIHGVRPGKVYFDMSTNSPTLMRHIHEEFAKVGGHVLDASVSGGPRGARVCWDARPEAPCGPERAADGVSSMQLGLRSATITSDGASAAKTCSAGSSPMRVFTCRASHASEAKLNST